MDSGGEMSKWENALELVDQILDTPVEDGFPVPPGLFDDLGPVPEHLAGRAQKTVEDITERIAGTQSASDAVLAELSWTRDRMEDLPKAGGSPVYLDLTA